MLQPARLFVAAILAVFTCVALTPSSTFAQNGSRKARRQALRASRPYAPGTYGVAHRAPANPADVQAVTQAYRLLTTADHDYQGHRVKAIEHLRKAGRVLGVSLKGGDTKAKEQQATSDTQLKQAQTVLQTMNASGANGKRHQRAMTHVQSALGEIQTALSIK